jgi:hypothetical protein
MDKLVHLGGNMQLKEREDDLIWLSKDVPLVRGLGAGDDSVEANWHIAGNGRRIMKARMWMKEGAPKWWKSQLGMKFLQDMRSKHIIYKCPVCKLDI